MDLTTTVPKQRLSLAFQVPDRSEASVEVIVEPNRDPKRYGLSLLLPDFSLADTSGLPTCHAVLESPLSQGYASMYGWIQLVRSEKSQSEWEDPIPITTQNEWVMDPIPITSDLNTPFTWFGPEPQLFDAPIYRGLKQTDRQMDWTARSFLTYIDDCLISQVVKPVLAFEWGFDVRNGEISMKSLRRLELHDWDGHVPLLRKKFANWQFMTQGELAQMCKVWAKQD